MLGSCVNTIEITENGLESFLNKEMDSSETGEDYLRMSGVLQILVAQHFRKLCTAGSKGVNRNCRRNR